MLAFRNRIGFMTAKIMTTGKNKKLREKMRGKGGGEKPFCGPVIKISVHMHTPLSFSEKDPWENTVCP